MILFTINLILKSMKKILLITYSTDVSAQAPEAISEMRNSAKSDMWSFGVMLWELFSCGEEPYEEYNDAEAIEAIGRGFRFVAMVPGYWVVI